MCSYLYLIIFKHFYFTKNGTLKGITTAGGARGVVVIVVGNGHGDTSSNPGRD